MLAIDFLKNPAKFGQKGVYALYGEDAYLRREALIELRKLALPDEQDDLAIARFAGEQAKLADVLDELRTLPFFAKCRFVVVEGADPFVTAHRKELETYVESPLKSAVLILQVKSWPANTKLAKLVEKNGLAIECKGPKESALIPWLNQFAQTRYDVRLEKGVAELLLELVGTEIGLLVAELEKLAIYVGGTGAVQRQHVAKLVGAGRIETIWKVIEAATTGHGALALEQLDGLLASGEHPIKIVSAMSSSLLKVHHAGRLRRLKMDLKEACKGAGIYPFAVETTQLQHAHLGPTRVDRLPKWLLQTDLDLKGASLLAPRVILERLFVELSTPRQD